MLKKRDLIFLPVIALLGVAACTRNLTCPAFQSQYLIDEQARHDQFTLFNPDSTPKYSGYVKKNKHGLAAKYPYVRKINDMRTIAMVKHFPPVSDSIQMFRSTDSTQIASASAASTKYLTVVNNDQLIYNSLYGSLLIKKEKPEENISEELKPNADSVQTQPETNGDKKVKFNLFKKKNTGIEENPGKDHLKPQPAPVENNQKLGAPPVKTNPRDSTGQDDGF